MLNSKSFLAVDFGAGSLKLAEFAQNEAGGLHLKQYAVKALGMEGSHESTREATILKALQELLAEKSFGSKQVNACAPGFHVFSKFVKLPPVDSSKITQIIRYEAQQNVPFPLEEVVWDYQILGTSPTNELEVLLVAVKNEIVDGLFRVAEGAGLRIKLVDVSPAALCNAFRYNYGDLEGCTMLLDIGAKTSNLLFFENGKIYSRSINIGANSITQDFASEAKLRFAQAEAIKIEKGFVSLGGAYEEPEDPQAAAISKIARQVMTRLHLQVNQTIQFFRTQQGGSAPQRVFLSGGASIMPYAAQFFAEKLNLPVDYFNPFRNIEINPELDLEDLSKYAHAFGEVVGLGLRDMAHCPVEMNLIPESSAQRQEFAQKTPYFVAAVFSLVLVVFAIGWAQNRIASVRQTELEKVKNELGPLTQKNQQLGAALAARDKLQKQADQMIELATNRFYWPDLLAELRRTLQQAETKTREKLKTNENVSTEFGLWIEDFSPSLPSGSPFFTQSDSSQAPRSEPAGGRRYSSASPSSAPPPPGASNEISSISMVCRGINRENMSANANAELAFSLKEEMKASPLFAEPITLGDIRRDDTNTFSFTLTCGLKRPLKL